MKSTFLLTLGGVLLLGLTSGCVTPAMHGSYQRTAARRPAYDHTASRPAAPRRVTKLATERGASGAADRKRSDAQFRAAQARWQRDDVTGCRLLLETLLARDPNHRGALLLNAELALLEGTPRRVIPALRKLCARRPDDAQAHHTMAMLLDAAGRRADAISYYEVAAGLEPEDALYQLSFNAATASDADILVRHGLAPAAAVAGGVPGSDADVDEEAVSSDAEPVREFEQVSFNEELPENDSQEPEYLQLDDLPAPLRSARMTAGRRGLPALRRGSRTLSRSTPRPPAAAAVASDVGDDSE